MRKIFYILLWVLSWGILGYALFAYLFLDFGSTVNGEMRETFNDNIISTGLHIFGAGFALLLGPLQFYNGLRRRWPKIHRYLGYGYLIIGVLLGGIFGFVIAQTAFGGIVSRWGFSGMAIVWLYTGWQAFRYASNKQYLLHRDWMYRNYAVTCAAITLRIYIGLFVASGQTFEDFYPLLAWLSWVPNLLFVEWFLLRSTPLSIESKTSS